MHRPRHLLSITAIACPLAAVGAGCAADRNDAQAQELPRLGDARVSFSEDHFPPSFSAQLAETANAAEPKKELPRDAFELDEWHGRELIYEPETPGFIYVFDQTDNRIVYSGHLHRGERFVLDRQRARATINGEIAYAQDGDEARNYKVYFDRDD